MEQESIVREVTKIGNGAHIFAPKEWLGNQVKIILMPKGQNIKKEILNILEIYLEDIIGIYLVGSYAREEEEKDSDIDVIAISKNIKKEIISGKYHLSIAPLKGIKNTMKYHPELVIPRIREAKVILNPQLLEELNSYQINKKSFKKFVEDTKRIIKIDNEFIKLDELDGTNLKSKAIIYSIILRLRGIFLIKCILKKEKYSKKSFKKFVLGSLNEKEFQNVYEMYKSIRDKKKNKTAITLQTAKKLQEFLIKELKYLEN
jgi:predicted nucleotidyltransferase